MANLMNTYARLPVAFVRGQGVWLWDESGKRYLDALAGIAVNTLGHAHPRLVKALAEQAATLIHTSNLYQIQPRNSSPTKLAAIRHGRGVLLQFGLRSERGRDQDRAHSTATEGHRGADHHRHGEGLPRPHAGDAVGHRQPQGAGGFRAAGAPASCACPTTTWRRCGRWRRTTRTWWRCWSSRSRAKAASTSRAADYLRGLREICDANEWLLMLDEVQCGMGRTGKWFVYQHAGIRPDVVTAGQGPRLAACRSAPASPAAAPQACSSPATTAPPSAATRSRARRALTTLETIEGRRAARRTPTAMGRADPRRCRRETRWRTRGRGRHSRQGTDDRHRARPALRRTGEAALWSRACSSTSPPTTSSGCCRRSSSAEAEARKLVETLVPLVSRLSGGAQPPSRRGALSGSALPRCDRSGIICSSRISRAPSTSTCSSARAGSRTVQALPALLAARRPHAGDDLREAVHAHAPVVRGRHAPARRLGDLSSTRATRSSAAASRWRTRRR